MSCNDTVYWIRLSDKEVYLKSFESDFLSDWLGNVSACTDIFFVTLHLLLNCTQLYNYSSLHLLCQYILHRSLQVWRAHFCSGRLLQSVANKGSHVLCSHCSWWSITHSQISQMVPRLSHLDFSSWYHLWPRPLCTLLRFESPHLDYSIQMCYSYVFYLLFLVSDSFTWF